MKSLSFSIHSLILSALMFYLFPPSHRPSISSFFTSSFQEDY